MSRTYRRRGARYHYRWVLRDAVFEAGQFKVFFIDSRSLEGRRAIARFHSDSQFVIGGGVPRSFRRSFKRRQKGANIRELQRWLADPDHEPMVDVRHRHSAKWAWW